jgi:hypothetical protein
MTLTKPCDKVTIAMSALFDSGNGILISLSEIPQNLELRSVPMMRPVSISTKNPTWQFDYNVNNDDFAKHFGSMVQDDLYTSDTNWMYTALIQTAFKGPEPTWSQDGWSFVPVPYVMEDIVSVKQKSSALEGFHSLANLTVQTPAIRARLDCSNIEWPGNSSLWLQAQKELTKYMKITALDNYFSLEGVVYADNFTTRITAQGDLLQCCANLTRDAQYNPAVVAYWTENWWKAEDKRGVTTSSGTGGNFTVKWIRGPASFAQASFLNLDYLYFPEPPAIQALNCMPILESSQAEVTVEPGTGVVQQYRILETPNREEVAWSDKSQWRNLSKEARYSQFVADGRGNISQGWYYYDADVTIR